MTSPHLPAVKQKGFVKCGRGHLKASGGTKGVYRHLEDFALKLFEQKEYAGRDCKSKAYLRIDVNAAF
jgi:hypothetical protein